MAKEFGLRRIHFRFLIPSQIQKPRKHRLHRQTFPRPAILHFVEHPTNPARPILTKHTPPTLSSLRPPPTHPPHPPQLFPSQFPRFLLPSNIFSTSPSPRAYLYTALSPQLSPLVRVCVWVCPYYPVMSAAHLLTRLL